MSRRTRSERRTTDSRVRRPIPSDSRVRKSPPLDGTFANSPSALKEDVSGTSPHPPSAQTGSILWFDSQTDSTESRRPSLRRTFVSSRSGRPATRREESGRPRERTVFASRRAPRVSSSVSASTRTPDLPPSRASPLWTASRGFPSPRAPPTSRRVLERTDVRSPSLAQRRNHRGVSSPDFRRAQRPVPRVRSPRTRTTNRNTPSRDSRARRARRAMSSCALPSAVGFSRTPPAAHDRNASSAVPSLTISRMYSCMSSSSAVSSSSILGYRRPPRGRRRRRRPPPPETFAAGPSGSRPDLGPRCKPGICHPVSLGLGRVLVTATVSAATSASPVRVAARYAPPRRLDA